MLLFLFLLGDGDALPKSLISNRFKTDRDEIWHDRSSSYMTTSWLLIWRRNFKILIWRRNFKICILMHIVYMYSISESIGVWDGGGQRVRATPPQKKSGKYFSGNHCVKFGHFSGKNHVKFGHFVNFSYIFFGQKCRWLSSYAYERIAELCELWTRTVWSVAGKFIAAGTGKFTVDCGKRIVDP